MEIASLVISSIGLVISIWGLLIGCKSLRNTEIIKAAQINEIKRERDQEIYNSRAPRMAMKEVQNDSGGTTVEISKVKDDNEIVDFYKKDNEKT